MEVFMKLSKVSTCVILLLAIITTMVAIGVGKERVSDIKKQDSIAKSKQPICQLMNSEKRVKLSGGAQFVIKAICGERTGIKAVARTPKKGNPIILEGIIVNDPLMDQIADQTTQNQPVIAADPVHTTLLIAYNDTGEFNFGATDSLSGYSISTDFGATWTDMGKLPTITDNWNLGSVGLASHNTSGTIYFVSMLCDSSACNMDKLLVGTTTDGGNSWYRLDNIAPIGVWDKPFIAVDNTGGTCDGYIYVVATDFIAAPAIKLIRSTDNGQTWDDPVVLNVGHENCDTGAIPRVASDGTVYVAWEDGGCIQPGDMPGIEMVKSTDCGVTWSTIKTVSTITPVLDPQATFECGVPALKGLIRTNDFPFIGIDPSDSFHLYVTFNSDPDGDNSIGDHSDVYFIQSTDGGDSWSLPVRLNDDTTLNDNFMPFLDVSSNGSILAGWYDRREDSSNLYMRIWATISMDGGNTWTNNFPIGSTIFPPAVNFDPLVTDCYMGDYNYATSNPLNWFVAWSDNERIESNPPHTGPRNDQDVYYTGFELAGPGGILTYSSSNISGGDADPYPEPGEILSLDVTVKNVGTGPVNNISGILTTNTSGVVILKQSSTYPDLVVGQSGVNDEKFQFWVNQDFVCGNEINFVLHLTSSEGLFQLNFKIITGAPGAPEMVFSEDFESGIGGWNAYDMCAGNLMWHLSTSCQSVLPNHTIPTSAYYGVDSACNYATGEFECGAIESPVINLSSYRGGALDFNYSLSTEAFCDYDSAAAQVSVDGGTSWTTVAGNCEIGNLNDPSTNWETITGIPIPDSNNLNDVRIRFAFDTVDANYNSYDGFYVDDVVVWGLTSECSIDPFAVQPYQKPHVIDSGNGIIEPDEIVTLAGHLENIGISEAPNVIGTMTTTAPVNIPDPSASYGNIAAGENKICTDCYDNVVAPSANRPATHWDFNVVESIAADGYGPYDYYYTFHVGGSFTDVPPSHMFYNYVETILHSEVTSGCTSTEYCPSNNVLRNQMAKFICSAMENASTGSCTTSACTEIFSDVPSSNPFCPFIEALYNAGIVNGCGTAPLRYCPSDTTRRQAMAKFICLGMDAANQGVCTVNPCVGIFQDVPASNPFCPYIETLYNASIVSGCSTNPMLYCPTDNVKRGQMAKFIVNAFKFSL